MDILEKICHGFGLIISRRNSTWCLKRKTWRKPKARGSADLKACSPRVRAALLAECKPSSPPRPREAVKDCRGLPVHARQLWLQDFNGPVSYYKIKLINKICAWFSNSLSIGNKIASFHICGIKTPFLKF